MLLCPDSHQRQIFESVDLDPDQPTLVSELAYRLGIELLVVRHGKIVGDAESRFVPSTGLYRIEIRGGLSLERKVFAGFHEIAEVNGDGIDEGKEDYCNRLAASMIAPRRAFLRRMREVGEHNFVELARTFRMTETGAALRAAEVQYRRLCVVTPFRVYARGDEWPDEGTVRGWVQQVLPGIRKTQLTDDQHRMVLEPVEEEATPGSWVG